MYGLSFDRITHVSCICEVFKLMNHFECYFVFAGYLKKEGCDNAFKAFLDECPHLKEYAMLLARGREYTKKVNGLTLQEYLDEYADLKKAGL
jgi:hypothetical protein